jgi:hypothetical protein
MGPHRERGQSLNDAPEFVKALTLSYQEFSG